MTSKTLPLLEISIPTYKRVDELRKCLNSIVNALKFIKENDRLMVGIAVRNNSTIDSKAYFELIEEFGVLFDALNVAFFEHVITGFNIGSVNNCSGGLFSSKCEYVWLLPDDDIVRFDSLKIALEVINEYKPCFISGGWKKKSKISYDSDEIGIDSGEDNEVYDVVYREDKIAKFLSKNTVQAQEYIYKVAPLRNFLYDDSNKSLLNEMFPGLLAVVCLQEPSPYVRLNYSLGIFRFGDPKSEWRHRWPKFALIDWPILSENMRRRGWLTEGECKKSISVFREVLFGLSKRPYALLGLHLKNGLSPFSLLKFHRADYIRALINSLLFFFHK